MGYPGEFVTVHNLAPTLPLALASLGLISSILPKRVSERKGVGGAISGLELYNDNYWKRYLLLAPYKENRDLTEKEPLTDVNSIDHHEQES